MFCLQIRPNDLTSLEGLSCFEFLPSINLSRLDTYHLLETILWLEITHGLCFLRPRIPDHYIIQVISYNFKNLLSTFADCHWMFGALGRRVDPVSFSSDRNGGVGFGLCGGSNFVNVFASIEASDCNLADILLELSAIPSTSPLGLIICYPDINTYFNPQVRVHQRLEFPRLSAFVPNQNTGLQFVFVERNRVD
jgi:hypothetical protein